MSIMIHFMVEVLKDGYKEGTLDTLDDEEAWKRMRESSYNPLWAFGLAVSFYPNLYNFEKVIDRKRDLFFQ